jgi:hypothetical protein
VRPWSSRSLGTTSLERVGRWPTSAITLYHWYLRCPSARDVQLLTNGLSEGRGSSAAVLTWHATSR